MARLQMEHAAKAIRRGYNKNKGREDRRLTRNEFAPNRCNDGCDDHVPSAVMVVSSLAKAVRPLEDFPMGLWIYGARRAR